MFFYARRLRTVVHPNRTLPRSSRSPTCAALESGAFSRDIEKNCVLTVCRMAEDDSDGTMAKKVLVMLWDVAHREETHGDIVELASGSIVKILGSKRCHQDFSWCAAQRVHTTLPPPAPASVLLPSRSRLWSIRRHHCTL